LSTFQEESMFLELAARNQFPEGEGTREEQAFDDRQPVQKTRRGNFALDSSTFHYVQSTISTLFRFLACSL
jgi:hypothetical protein